MHLQMSANIRWKMTSIYDKLHDVLKWEADNQKVVLICDFNADINPWERDSDDDVVGPYGLWKKPTNDNAWDEVT